MALETRTVRVCDVCGETTQNDGIKFAWGTDFYETDLCDEHGAELTRLIETIIKSSRRLGVDRTLPRPPTHPFLPPTPKRSLRVDTAAVREWAKGKGIEVSDKGRLPASLVAAYQEAVRSA